MALGEATDMRVVIISQYFPPDMGGGATRAQNAARGLTSVGCDVTVVAAVPHYPRGDIPKRYRWKPLVIENHDGITLIRTFVPPVSSQGLLRRIILFLSFVFSSLLALFYIRRPDVVWTANPNVISVFPGVVYRKLFGCLLVQNVDDLWPEALADLGTKNGVLIDSIGPAVAQMAYSLVDGITPISEGYVSTLTDKYHVPPQKIRVVKAGVDIDRFCCHDEGTAGGADLFRVLYIGAFSPAYNFEQVFEAARQLSAHEDIVFTVQGGGEEAARLRRLEEQAGVANIHVVEKIVSREEVARELVGADALLLPLCGVGSIEMGISSKLYEYQAAGKPILCCSSGQPGAYVLESRSGIVIEPGNAKALAEAVLFLKQNPERARQLGENGRRYVEEHLTVDAIGRQLAEFFEWLDSRRGGNKRPERRTSR